MSSLENFINRRQDLYNPFESSRKTGVIFFSISLIVHALFFFGMIFFQKFRLPKPMLPVVQVDLVTFSEETESQDLPGKKEPPKETPKEEIPEKEISKEEKIPVIPQEPDPPPKIKKIPHIKPDISLKTKPKNLKELIAKQAKKKKLPEKKISEKKKSKPSDPDESLEKEIEDQNKNAIANALKRFEKKVQDQSEKKRKASDQTSSGTGKKGYKPIDLYKMVLASEIEQNWVFNDILARLDQNLEVRILLKILKSGEIRDIIYETRSENRYLDESAKKAIKKTNPLPPLPSGMNSYDVVVIFTPKGLK